MNLRRLRAFIVLAEELHFSRAAARCNITQSALSQQLRQLEEELQVELIHRTQRTIILTRAGHAFLAEVRKIVAEMDQAIHLTREIGGGLGGYLVVGTTAPLLYIAMPDIVDQFKRAVANVQILVRVMTTAEQQESLRKGEIDIGICHPPLDDFDLNHEIVAELPFNVVMSTSNPLAKRSQLFFRDLATESFILFTRATAPSVFDSVLAKCHENGFSPKIVLEASPAQSIVALAACGMGIGLIASDIQKFDHHLAAFRRLEDPPMLQLGVAYATTAITPAAKALVEIIRKTGADLR
jgi:DNA-binding transcriptional LysR family regulator